MAEHDDSRGGGLSSTARLTLVAATVAVLIAAFFVARSGGDDESSPAATQPPAERPASGEEQDGYTDAIPRNPEAEAPTLRTVRVRDGAPVGGVRTLTYRRGDDIRLRVTSDVAEEVHVHGFDVEKPVGPSTPARFRFDADIEGRFEVELHGSGAQIATLEVRPKS